MYGDLIVFELGKSNRLPYSTAQKKMLHSFSVLETVSFESPQYMSYYQITTHSQERMNLIIRD